MQGLKNISIPIGKMMVNELYSQCAIHLRTVGDIPRLYRRTNKEAPTKCFNYVHQMLSVINDFRSLHQDHAKNVDEWTRGVLQVLSKQLSIEGFFDIVQNCSRISRVLLTDVPWSFSLRLFLFNSFSACEDR